MEQLEWTFGLNFNSSSCPNQHLLLLQMNSCLCSFSDTTWRLQGAHSCPHGSSEDTSSSPALFLGAHLEAARCSGLPVGLLLLSWNGSSLKDTSPSPSLFLRAWEKRGGRFWGRMRMEDGKGREQQLELGLSGRW